MEASCAQWAGMPGYLCAQPVEEACSYDLMSKASCLPLAHPPSSLLSAGYLPSPLLSQAYCDLQDYGSPLPAPFQCAA